jgi:hypothetical protein
MKFEFGETDQVNAFFDLYPAFERLMTLAKQDVVDVFVTR